MYSALRVIGVLLSVLTGAGCFESEFQASFEADMAQLNQRLDLQQAKLKELDAQVNDGLTLALCTSELRQLLEDVQKECAPSADSSPGVCATKQIRPAVMGADPEHRGRFLKLMSHLPHEVIYIAKDADARAIIPYRLERLDRLTKPALLTRTVFLIVSSPEAGEGEALRRALLVEGLLLARKIPPSIIRRWLYAFPDTKADIVRQSDQPTLAETRELHRGVWVFRADC